MAPTAFVLVEVRRCAASSVAPTAPQVASPGVVEDTMFGTSATQLQADRTVNAPPACAAVRDLDTGSGGPRLESNQSLDQLKPDWNKKIDQPVPAQDF